MSGVWSQILQLDLSIPSNGALTPGSGTIYIGGPQLPVGLAGVGGYQSAIVWYTDAVGLAAGIDYWFLAHFSNGALNQDGVRWGYYPTGGPTTVPMVTPLTNAGAKQTIIEAINSVQLKMTSLPNNTIFLSNQGAFVNSKDGFTQLNADGNAQLDINSDGAIFLRPGIVKAGGPWTFVDFSVRGSVTGNERAAINNLGVAPSIKAVQSATIDTWLTSTTTQTGTTNGGTVMATATVELHWRTTIDRIVDLRCFVNWNAFPPASQYIGFFLPNVLPMPDTFTANGIGPYFTGISWRTDNSHFSPITARMDLSGNTHITAFVSTSPGATDNALDFSGTYTTTKP